MSTIVVNKVQPSGSDLVLSASGKIDMSGAVNISGSLNVYGTTTVIDTVNLQIEDPLILLAKNSTGTVDAGLVVERGSAVNAAFLWDESEDCWVACTVPAAEIGGTAGNVTIDSYSCFKAGSATFTGSLNLTGALTCASDLKVDGGTLFVDASENTVGIGTISPTEDLHIKAEHPTIMLETNDTNGDGQIRFQSAAGTRLATIRCDTTANALNQLSINAGTQEDDLVIKSDGKIGIGTTSPSQLLHVAGAAEIDGNLQVDGDLTVNGSTTTVNSTTLTVDDKNIELGSVSSPSDTTADGGGVTLKGASDKTILWTNSTDRWHFNQGIELDAGNMIVESGNVGVGTTSPASAAGIARFIEVSDESSAGIVLDDTGGRQWNIYSADSKLYHWNSDDGHVLTFWGKDVGIGTATPATRFDIVDTRTNQFRLSYDTSNYTSFGVSSAGDLNITPSGGDATITATTSIDLKSPQIDIGEDDTSDVTINLLGSTNDMAIVYDESANVLNFDSNTLAVDGANNRVGIGTASPAVDLEISAEHPKLRFQTEDAGGDTQIEFKSLDGSALALIRCQAASNALDHLSIGVGTSEDDFVLDSTGKIGIGVQDPDNQLEIYSDGDQLKLSNNAADYATFDVGTNGDLTITTVDAAGGDANFTVAADGGVDIDANAGVLSLDGSGGINIGTEADVAIDIDASTLDIDASGAVSIDGAGIALAGGANASSFNVATGGADAKDLTLSVTGGGDSSLILSSAGTGADALSLDATAGSMVIGPNLADGQTLKLGKNGAVETIIAPHGTAGSEKYSVTNTAGTTDGTNSDGAILLNAVAGGISLLAADTKDIWAEAGQVVITANHDTNEAIKLHADAGTSQTIQIINDAGTTDGAEGAGAIDIEATVGGIGIHAADDKDIWVEAGQVVITANHNASESIKLHADAGANQTIQIINDAGTTDGSEGAGAIDIEATVGGISLHGADDKDISIEAGQVVLTANHDTASSIKLHADAGTSQTIVVVNDAGTSESAIAITSTAGGVDIDAAAGKDVTIDGGQLLLTSAHDVANSIYIRANAGTSETIKIHSDQGTGAASVELVSDVGGVTISGDTDHGVILGNISSAPVTIGHTTSETTVSDNLTVTGTTTHNDNVKIIDDKTLTFGTNDDWTFEYDENGDDALKMAGTTMHVTSDTVSFNSANQYDPLVIIKSTHNGADGARLRFVKDKGAAGANNDIAGLIEFYADDAAQDNILFASIEASVAEATNGQEGGQLTFRVATHDGEAQPGLMLTDGSAEDEVDVTIGNGAASVTTIAGTLDLGDRNITNVGDIDLDSISVADATIGLNIDLSGANTEKSLITLRDNVADALSIKSADAKVYMKFVTTDDQEAVQIPDDRRLYFGSDGDLFITYDEATRDALLIGQNGSKALQIEVDTVSFVSENATDPIIEIRNEANDADAARLRFNKKRINSGTVQDALDNDDIAKIEFYSYDDGTPSTQQYAEILVEVSDASSGAEGGKLSLKVAEHDGTVTTGLLLQDGDADGEIDVTIGAGAASVTTIAGVVVYDGVTADGPGAGFSEAQVTEKIRKVNNEIITTITIDLHNSNSVRGPGTLNHVIGDHLDGGSAENNAYFAKITQEKNGYIYRVEMGCIEQPAGGVADIDIRADTNGTRAAGYNLGSGTAVITAGGNWDRGHFDGTQNAAAATALAGGLDDYYLYLTQGAGGGGAQYSAGKFVIKLYGANF